MEASFLIGLLQVQNQMRMYHWQTFSHARHKSTDEFVHDFNKLVDQFVETFQGCGRSSLQTECLGIVC